MTRVDDFFAAAPLAQLFHYTDADGFLGILKTKKIWATDAGCLNDRQELLYAKELITDHLDVLCEEPTWNPNFRITSDEKTLLDRYRYVIREAHTLPDVYVASFSTNGDNLSQWREYGRYNIGVSGAALQFCAQRAQAILAPCVYHQPRQMELIRGFMKLLIKAYRRHRDADRLWKEIRESLCRYGALLKHPSFEEESEWRIVVPDVPTLGRLEFRQSNQIVVPYVEVDIRHALQTCGNSPVVPQVNLGPGNDRLMQKTVERLTKKTVGFEVYVHRSDTPYVQD